DRMTAAPTLCAVAEPAFRVKAPRGTESVLVVDDDPRILDLVRRILERAGYTVIVASCGAELAHVLDEHDGPIDLFLCDVLLPGPPGPEVVAETRAMGWNPRVLYMSGYPDARSIQGAVLEEGAAYLPKPFTPFSLLSRRREII